MKKIALPALLALSPLTASADIHKCVANGQTTYQDPPCAQGETPLSNSGTLSTLPIQVPDIPSPPSESKQRSQRPSYNSRNNSYNQAPSVEMLRSERQQGGL